MLTAQQCTGFDPINDIYHAHIGLSHLFISRISVRIRNPKTALYTFMNTVHIMKKFIFYMEYFTKAI